MYYVGWCREGTHDKIWGVTLLIEGSRTHFTYPFIHKYLIFWGRRGAKLRTKIDCATDYDIRKQISQKSMKGYQNVTQDKLDIIYPEFSEDLEKAIIWAKLKV